MRKKSLALLLALFTSFTSLMPLTAYAEGKPVSMASETAFDSSTEASESIDNHKDNRLIVVSDTKPDSYGAEEIVKTNTNMYLLSFKDSSLCESAFISLKDKGVTVEYDESLDSLGNDDPKEEASQSSDISFANADNISVENKDIEKENKSGEVSKEDPLTVAIIDTGLNDKISITDENGVVTEEENPVFKDRISDKTSDDAIIDKDGNQHGTEIATIIAQNTDKNVRILPIKAFDKEGKGTVSSTFYGIMEALEKGADIINISASGKGESKVLEAAIDYCYEKNVPVIVSAGNNGDDVSSYTPANVAKAYTVGSLDKGSISETSNKGTFIDCYIDGYFDETNEIFGTSYATAKMSSYMASLLTEDKGILKDDAPMESITSFFSSAIADNMFFDKVAFDSKLKADIEARKEKEEENAKEEAKTDKAKTEVKKDSKTPTASEDTNKAEPKSNENTKIVPKPVSSESASEAKPISLQDSIDNIMLTVAGDGGSDSGSTGGNEGKTFYGTWRQTGDTVYLVLKNAKSGIEYSGLDGSILRSDGKGLRSVNYEWKDGYSQRITDFIPNIGQPGAMWFPSGNTFYWVYQFESIKNEYGNDKGGWFYVHDINSTEQRVYKIWPGDLTPATVTHTVSYHANGGGGADQTDSHTHNIGTDYTYSVPSYNPWFSVPGYQHFVGWSQSAGNHTASGNVDINAQWEYNTYNVSYNTNGGSGSFPTMGCTSSTTNSTYGYAPTKTNTLYFNINDSSGSTRSSGVESTVGISYKFNYWNASTSDVDYIPSVIGIGEAFNGYSKENPGSVSLTANWSDYTYNLPNPTRIGYKFTGWTSSYDGKTYPGGSNVNISHNAHVDVTFTANWQPWKTTIIYDLQGGKGDSTTQHKYFDDIGGAVYTHKAPVKDGYYFSGYKVVGGTEDGTVYEGSTHITFDGSLTSDGTVNLIAQWQPVEVNVVYVGNGDNQNSYFINGDSTTGDIKYRDYTKLVKFKTNQTFLNKETGETMTYTQHWTNMGWSLSPSATYKSKSDWSVLREGSDKISSTTLLQAATLNDENTASPILYDTNSSNSFYKGMSCDNVVKYIADSKNHDKVHSQLSSIYKGQDHPVMLVSDRTSGNNGSQYTQAVVFLFATWDEVPYAYSRETYISRDALDNLMNHPEKYTDETFDTLVCRWSHGIDTEDGELKNIEIDDRQFYYDNFSKIFEKLGEYGLTTVRVKTKDKAGNIAYAPCSVYVTNMEGTGGSSGYRKASQSAKARFISEDNYSGHTRLFQYYHDNEGNKVHRLFIPEDIKPDGKDEVGEYYNFTYKGEKFTHVYKFEDGRAYKTTSEGKLVEHSKWYEFKNWIACIKDGFSRENSKNPEYIYEIDRDLIKKFHAASRYDVIDSPDQYLGIYKGGTEKAF